MGPGYGDMATNGRARRGTQINSHGAISQSGPGLAGDPGSNLGLSKARRLGKLRVGPTILQIHRIISRPRCIRACQKCQKHPERLSVWALFWVDQVAFNAGSVCAWSGRSKSASISHPFHTWGQPLRAGIGGVGPPGCWLALTRATLAVSPAAIYPVASPVGLISPASPSCYLCASECVSTRTPPRI